MMANRPTSVQFDSPSLPRDERERKSIQYRVNINPPSTPIPTKHLNLLLIRSQIKIRTKQSCRTHPRYSHAQSNDCIWDRSANLLCEQLYFYYNGIRFKILSLDCLGLSNFTFTIPVAVSSWIKQRKLVVRLMDVFYFGRALKSDDSDPSL